MSNLFVTTVSVWTTLGFTDLNITKLLPIFRSEIHIAIRIQHWQHNRWVVFPSRLWNWNIGKKLGRMVVWKVSVYLLLFQRIFLFLTHAGMIHFLEVKFHDSPCYLEWTYIINIDMIKWMKQLACMDYVLHCFT